MARCLRAYDLTKQLVDRNSGDGDKRDDNDVLSHALTALTAKRTTHEDLWQELTSAQSAPGPGRGQYGYVRLTKAYVRLVRKSQKV